MVEVAGRPSLVSSVTTVFGELAERLWAPRPGPGLGLAPAWSTPTDAELDASIPTAASVGRTRRRRATRTVSHAVVVMPRDPRALVAAQRIVDALRHGLPPGSVVVTSDRQAASSHGVPGSLLLDLADLSGDPALGRFRLPDPARETWRLQATAAGQGGVRLAVSSGSLWGAQHAVTELLEDAGYRYLSYNHTAQPAAGSFRAAVPGTTASGAGTGRFAYRGMAPHTYHPIELSQALHDPSPRSMEVLRRYVDWNVATGQNVIQFPLLDVEASNVVVKLGSNPQRRAAWEAHVREFNAYAAARGVQIAANASFTMFTPAHLMAMGILGATVDSVRLNRRQREWLEAPKGSDRAAAKLRSYERLLGQVVARHERSITPLVQRLESLGFAEAHFNLGTSEFTSPNDDLQVAWMETAQRAAERSGGGMRVTVGSHVPAEPTSPRYGVPMFDLHRRADAKVGAHIHTVQVPGLTDRAETYGTPSFAHKLATLDAATSDRLETWYPETSYWVQYDVTVPLYLPVYMLARHRDHRRLLDNDRIDGQLTFTTAWEWGYWMNDAAMARMTTKPNASLTELLVDILEPLGAARDATVDLLGDVMRSQQRMLVDGALLRHLQGLDALSTLGETLGKVPGLNKFVHASSNVPLRTGWSKIKLMDRAQVDEFAATDVRQLTQLLTQQQAQLERARRIRAGAASASADAQAILDEIVDGLEINVLRSRQVIAALETMLLSRRMQLGESGLRDALDGAMAVTEAMVGAATVVIRRREAQYRESPADAFDGDGLSSGAQGTMWGDRSLTPVHTLKYWAASVNEARRAASSVGAAKA